jgi:outer membrane protein OmpA-like peptidoglycan-associated protein
MAIICVVVDNKRRELLLPISEGASGSLPLTTIRSDQDCALIEVVADDAGRGRALYTLRLNKLVTPKPEIDVRGRIHSDTLHLEFDVQGKTRHRKAIKLGSSSRHGWLFVPALLLVCAIGLFFVSRTVRAPDSPREPAIQAAVRSVSLSQRESEPPALAASQDDDRDAGRIVALEPNKASVYFLPDSAVLTDEAKAVLDTLLRGLTFKEGLRIVGHCALAGTERGRIDLSIRRARSVQDHLLAGGWPSNNQPTISGLGGSDPATRDPERQHLNRRVDIAQAINGDPLGE